MVTNCISHHCSSLDFIIFYQTLTRHRLENDFGKTDMDRMNTRSTLETHCQRNWTKPIIALLDICRGIKYKYMTDRWTYNQ